jgi:hypothetical protein
MQFKDINFKISVIGALHELGFYNDEAEALKDKYYDADDFSYQPIPQVYDYYKKLTIDQDKLDKIQSLQPDGGDMCYVYLMNNWDGEDDQFTIKSIEGIELLANLKSFDPISMIEEGSLDYTPLLKCKHLEKVSSVYAKDGSRNEKVIGQLDERGVDIV